MGKGSKWSKSNHTGRFSGPFAGKLIELYESPAYRVLSLAALRVLARLEIELIHHGGHENGSLTVTFRQFEDYGVHRDSVAAGIRELEALGFIEITDRGCAGNADVRKASKYRLTFRPAVGAPEDGSHKWREARLDVAVPADLRLWRWRGHGRFRLQDRARCEARCSGHVLVRPVDRPLAA